MKNILIDMLITWGIIILLSISMICLSVSNVNGGTHIKAKTKAIRVLFIIALVVLLIGNFAIIFC